MPFDAPFSLGPFRVGPDGRLSLATPDSAPRFSIEWRGCRVDAGLDVGADGTHLCKLSLVAMVGRVPSTASGGADHGRRERDGVFAALRALPATLPPGWQADLTADHRVVLLTATKVEMPTTVDQLLIDVTQFLLALGPYLDLLAELGMEAPGAGMVAGMVKT